MGHTNSEFSQYAVWYQVKGCRIILSFIPAAMSYQTPSTSSVASCYKDQVHGLDAMPLTSMPRLQWTNVEQLPPMAHHRLGRALRMELNFSSSHLTNSGLHSTSLYRAMARPIHATVEARGFPAPPPSTGSKYLPVHSRDPLHDGGRFQPRPWACMSSNQNFRNVANMKCNMVHKF